MLNLPSSVGCTLQGGGERKQPRLQFGQFEADLEKQQLYKRGLPVRLENLPFLVLAALLERPGSPVSREELRLRLWPNGTHVDFDEGLNTAVRKLRHALGDSADSPLFIETVPRKGYILIAPVAEASASPDVENVQHLGPGNNSGNGIAVEVRPTPISPMRSRNFFYVLAVGLVVLAVILGQVFRRHAPSQPNFARLSFRRGTIVTARLSPDGQQVVFGAAWDGKPFRLFLVRPGSPDIRDLGIEADILAISRSGQMAVMLHRHFGFGTVWSRGILATVSLTGTVPKEMLDDVSSADWSPDGSQLAVVHYFGGSCRLEFPVGHITYEATGGAWISHARISPDGDRIAFLEHPLANDDAGHAVILNLRNGQKILSKDFSAIVGLAWEDAGNLLFTASEAGVGGGRAIFRFEINGSQSLVRRESVALTIHDVTADRGLLLTRDLQGDEVFGHFQDGDPDRIVSCLNVCVPADLSADGSQLLVSGQGEGVSPGYRAYLLPTAGGAAPKLLGNGQPTGFAPDMQSVIVLFPWGIDPTQIAQLRSLPVGPGEPKALTHDSISHIWATWFPDGKRFLFLGAEPHHAARSWTQEVDAPNATPLTPEGVIGLKISPDGKTVAAIGSDKKLWLYPASGGTPKLLGNVNADEEVDRWSADGKSLFVTVYGLPAEVDRIDVRTGTRSLVQRVSPPDPAGVLAVGPVLVSADAQIYVYAYPRYLSTLYIVHGL
jgi:DNA-binding winged helix-turn-helix (wHTH) protein/Tol biopolymer transport system component